MDTNECTGCGAPHVAGLVGCPYCSTAYAGAASAGPRVDCPKCGADNRVDARRCALCGKSLMRTCIFCQRPSALRLDDCGHCGEAFEGAREREVRREEAARQQRMMNLAATGLGALGAAARSSSGQRLLGQLWNEVKTDFSQNAYKK